jgi:hypothetical protein
MTRGALTREDDPMTQWRCALAILLACGLARTAAADVAPVGNEFQVNTYTTANQTLPRAGADAAGNFVVVWESGSYYGPTQDGSRTGVFFQRHAPGGGRLGSEARANTITLGPQRAPTVAVRSTGEFVVTWTGGGYPFDQDGSESGAFLQLYDASGMPVGGEMQANTYTTGDQGQTAVAIDGGGSFVVVWQSGEYYGAGQDGSHRGIFGQRFTSAGTPLGSEFQINTYTTDDQVTPAVAADPAGNFVVVWQSGDYYGSGQDGSSAGIFAQRFSSTGARVGPEFQVNTYTTRNQRLPAVTMDAGGGFVVVWEGEGDGDYGGVFAKRFAADGMPVGGEFLVNTYTEGDQQNPAVAADPAGNFVVVWDTYAYYGGPPTRDRTGIFGQHFAVTTDPLGPEFQVNSFTTSYQFLPDVTADADSNFVVVWASRSYPVQDGSGSGVFAQRFRTTGFTPPVRVQGTRLVLRADAARPTRKRLLLRSADPTVDLGGGNGSTDDPTLSGGRVVVRSAAFETIYELPSFRWSHIGPPGAGRGYEYRDSALVFGPIHLVQVRPGKLRVMGKGAQLGHVLDSNPDPVQITVQIGQFGKRHCMSFGGLALYDPGKGYRAAGAPPPASCRQ